MGWVSFKILDNCMTLLNWFHLLHLFNALYLDISRTAQCLNISKMELYNYCF